MIVRKNSNESLAMMLADNGYDVWLGNNRGNKYSYKHTHLKPSDDKFWDFSLDEQIMIDIPTMLEYVLTTTEAEKKYLI